jgi:hypothetical protein
MSERDTMHSISLMIQPSHISPATAVWCDPGVRVTARHDHRTSHLGLDVWCDPGVWLDPAPPALAALPLPAASPVAEEQPDLSAFDRWLPRFEPDARVALPAIPTELTFAERATQRCHALAARLGWEHDALSDLLLTVLEAGSPDHVLVRVVEDHDIDWSARVLHTAWELRRMWHTDGPLSGWMSWHHAVVLVTSWHEEHAESEELVAWLDEAFMSWRRCRLYQPWWVFHEELVDWLVADGPDALLHDEFPWDDIYQLTPSSEPSWR